MVNPDGVIIGNYRSSISGNDLNRRYHDPDYRLHPTVYAIKNIVKNYALKEGGRMLGFIDIHGHSRKKNVFIYGPYQPLHSDKYLKMRVLPKILSERT